MNSIDTTVSRVRIPGHVIPGLLSSNALFVVDSKQRIVEWSRAAERLTGLQAETVIARRCYEVLAANNGSRAASVCGPDCIVMANAKRRRPTFDFDIHIAQGDRRVIANMTTLVAPEDAEMNLAVVHLLRDVTDQRMVASLLSEARQKTTREAGDQSPAALSPREQQVIQLLASGYRVTQISGSLGLSPFTVRNHITHAMTKLGARSRLEAIIVAVRQGLV